MFPPLRGAGSARKHRLERRRVLYEVNERGPLLLRFPALREGVWEAMLKVLVGYVTH